MNILRNMNVFQKLLVLIGVSAFSLVAVSVSAYYMESYLQMSGADIVKVMAVISLIGIIICILIGIAIARMIHNPLLNLAELIKQAGDGNLKVQGKVLSHDEIGELVEVFNASTAHQAEVVRTIRFSSEQLAAASQEMAASSEEITSSSEEISKNIVQVAEEAKKGDDTMVEASKSLLELSSLVQIAKSRAESAASNSEVTKNAANDGRNTVVQTIKSMDSIKQRTLETEELIATLSRYSEQIGLITDTITNIARQTNLLALNAAIEAARAGEAGRGFAVVAEEVRKLAEQSDKGASEVAALVQKVSESTDAAVTAMQQSRTEVEEGVTAVNNAGQALDNILSAVETTVKEIGNIANLTDEEVAKSEQIVTLINDLASVLEKTDHHAQQVAAAAQEITAAMENIASSAEQTSAMSTDLNNAVEKFEV